jgi:hypothetical protein
MLKVKNYHSIRRGYVRRETQCQIVGDLIDEGLLVVLLVEGGHENG